MKKWTKEVMGSQLGKTVLITGGTTKVGIEVARELAFHGAKVILCAEDVLKGQSAIEQLVEQLPSGQAHVSFEVVDLSDLESVKNFGQKFLSDHEKLHVLINNAELIHVPRRMLTPQGHELLFSYNYLSHFALTATLFPLMQRVQDARVIFQSNLRHSPSEVDFFDLDGENSYRPNRAFSQSKLALLVFARELDRRLRAIQLDVKSIPIHSGGFTGPALAQFFQFTFRRHPIQAALPILFAATATEALGGHYYGPTGFYELWGAPGEIDFLTQAKNLQTAEKLWEISEQLTGVDFKLHDLSNVVPFHLKGLRPPEFFT